MIEPLNIEIWTTEPAGLDGLATIKSEPKQRLICSYFPPHTSFDKPLLETPGIEHLKMLPVDGLTDIDTSAGTFYVAGRLEIALDNGGAVYLLGKPDEQGTVEAWLWKLTEGIKASG